MTKTRITISALALCGAMLGFGGAARAGSYDYDGGGSYYNEQPSYGHSYNYQKKYYKPKPHYNRQYYNNDGYNGGGYNGGGYGNGY